MHGRLERDFARNRIVDATRLDFQLAIVLPDCLGNERKSQDRHPRVEGQARGAADMTGQLILRVNRGTGVHADRAHGHREHRDTGGGQQLSHPVILAYRRLDPSESG